MENLLSPDKKIRTSQSDILEEQRMRTEAAEELACHYEYFHNIKRPRLE